MGFFEFVEDTVGKVPIIGGALEAGTNQVFRPFKASVNFARGAAGSTIVVGKNLTWDLAMQSFGVGGRTGLFSDPFAAMIEYAQEDLARDVLGLPLDGVEGTGSGYGLFASRGVGGGFFGLVPSEIRDVTRKPIQKGVEGFSWAFNNGVDNPLSMLFTMLGRAEYKRDGLSGYFDWDTYSVFFDANEWKQAWDIAYVQERSAGQAFAANYYNIDPFDEKEYNAIKTNDLFNVMSGAIDLYKEWKDPIEKGVRGGMKVTRGETAIARVNDAGDVVKIYDYGIPFVPIRQAMPEKIWVVGEGSVPRKITYDKDITTSAIQQPANLATPKGMVNKAKGVFNKTDNLTQQDLAIRKTITTERAKGFVESKWFKKTFDAVETAVPSSKFSRQFQQTGTNPTRADQKLLDQRAVRWKQAGARKNNTEMPERVQYALATSLDPKAASRILREYLGDTTVKAEIAESIQKAGRLKDGDYAKRLDELTKAERALDLIKKRIEDYPIALRNLEKRKVKLDEDYKRIKEQVEAEITPTELEKQRRIVDDVKGLEPKEDTLKRITANRRRETTREKTKVQNEIQALKDQHKVDIKGDKKNNIESYDVQAKKLETTDRALWAEGAPLREVNWEYHFDFYNQFKVSQQKKVKLSANGDVDIAKSQVDEWDNLDRITAEIIIDGIVGEALIADGIIKSAGNRKVYQPIGVVHNNHLKKLKANTSDGWFGHTVSTFRNPATFLPLGVKFVKAFTSRVPQGLIHFTDMGGQSQVMFTRIIEDASEFTINGKKILDETEAAELVGQWQRHVAAGADYSTFSEFYGRTISKLVRKAENLMREENIKYVNDAGEWADVEQGFLVRQMNGAQKDFLNRLDEGHFKVLDRRDTAMTIDQAGDEFGRTRGGVVMREGEPVTDKMAYDNQASYLALSENEGVHIYTYNLNLAQLGECSVVPRFDLLQREIDRSINKTNFRVGGKKGTQKTGKLEDVYRSQAKSSVVTVAKGLQEVWVAGKLLSPRWTMRVLTDEKLRAAAVIGVLPMLGTINKGFNKFVQSLQARGLNLTDDGFAVALRNELNSRSQPDDALVPLGKKVESTVDPTVSKFKEELDALDKFKEELDALDAELFPPKWFESASPEQLLEAERLGVPVRRMHLMDDQFSLESTNLLDNDVWGGPYNTLDDLVAATERNLFDLNEWLGEMQADELIGGQANKPLAALQVKASRENKKFVDAVKSGDPDRIAAAIKSQMELNAELWRIMISPDPKYPEFALAPWLGASDPDASKLSFREIIEDPEFSMAIGDIDTILINIHRGAKKLKGTDVKPLIEVGEDATLIDIAKAVEDAGLDLEEVMDAASKRYIDEAIEIEKGATSVRGNKKLSYKRRKVVGTTTRMLVGGVINPLIGAGWGIRYAKNRSKNVQQAAVKSSARMIANSFQNEAARIIAKSANDPDILELAERLSSKGDALLDDLKWLEKEYDFGISWADKEKVVSLFDKADMWWDKAGYPRQAIGRRTFGNAWGSDIRFQRMSEKQISSANSLDESMRGPVAASNRQVVNNMGTNWEVVRVENVPFARMQQAWARTFMQSSRTGTKEIKFYNIMYDDTLTHVQKVERLADLIENTPRLRRKFEIQKHEGEGADKGIFKVVAEDAINEINDLLPAKFFPKLRKKVLEGEEIGWDDVSKEITSKEFLETWGLDNLEATGVNDIVAHIRKEYPDFGKAKAPEAQPKLNAPIRDFLREKVDSTFAALGTSAADDISRGPFFESRYTTHLIEATSPYRRVDGGYDLTPRDIIRMEDEARKAAFKDTRNVLYELAEHSEIAEMIGFASPFFNAWQEVIGRWAGLALENPAFAYKAIRMFTKDDIELPILGLTQEKDEYGNLNVVFRPSNSALASFLINPKFTNAISDAANQVLPSDPIGSVGKLADEVGITFDKDGLFTMLTQTTPRAGPFITFPIRTLMFDFKQPEVEELTKWMFPFGHPDGNVIERIVQEFAPAWANHVYYKALDPDNPFRLGNKQNYGLTMIDMVQYLDVKAREAGTPYDYTDPKVMDAVIGKAKEMTSSIGFLKFLGTTIIPVSAGDASPYTPHIKLLAQLEETGRDLKKPPEWAINKFIETYGEEFFFLSGNATRNAKGVAPTLDAFELSKDHKDFIDMYPVLAPVVTGSLRSSILEDAAFSPAVHQIFMNEGWREIYEPEDFIKEMEVQRGYVELNAWKDSPLNGEEGTASYNELLYARDGKSNSPNTENHAALKFFYDQKKAELSEKYPLFGEELLEFSTSEYTKNVIEGAKALVEEPSLAYKPWVGSLVEYLDIREEFINDLERLPNKSLEHSNNKLLWLEWEDNKSEFATRPDFSLFYSRFLENDFLQEGTWD